MAYLKEYTKLTPQETRQYFYKRKFKREYPDWDDSLVFLTRYFDKYTRNNLKVLDVGCGHGNWVIDEFRHKISQAIGIDISLEATKKNSCLDKIVIGNLECLPFENNSFDAVLSLWVLEHLESPEKAFYEIKRVIKPGGIFAFVTPNKKCLLIVLRRLVNKLNRNLSNKAVAKLYGRAEKDIFEAKYKMNSITEIKRLATRVGFKIEVLEENFDPSYTSFGRLSYPLTKGTYFLNSSLFKAHIVGILRI